MLCVNNRGVTVHTIHASMWFEYKRENKIQKITFFHLTEGSLVIGVTIWAFKY